MNQKQADIHEEDVKWRFLQRAEDECAAGGKASACVTLDLDWEPSRVSELPQKEEEDSLTPQTQTGTIMNDSGKEEREGNVNIH